MDGAEFIIEPSAPKQLEPVEEPKHDILGEMMKIRESVQKRPKPVCTGILPEYQVPYCDPPEYDENDRNKKRRKKIEKIPGRIFATI